MAICPGCLTLPFSLAQPPLVILFVRVESARNLVELIHEVRALQPGHVAGFRVKSRHGEFPLPGKTTTVALGILEISI